jgi:hypothetical protein
MLVFCGTFLFVEYKNKKRRAVNPYSSYYPAWSMATLATIFTPLVGVLILAVTSPFLSYNKVTTLSLDAISDGTTPKSSFFLGSGYINEEPSFMYYQKDGDAYTLRSIPSRHASIKYTTGDPHVDMLKPCSSIPGFRDLCNILWADDAVFYVPEGSIVNTFTLDAKN